MAQSATLLHTLLLVEDDDVLRGRMARAFGDRGMETLQAGDVASALSLAQAHKPEAVLLDLRLPDGSGLDLIGPLRRLREDCVVVVLTGYGSMATAVEAMRRGANHALPKPIDCDELISFLRRGPKPTQDFVPAPSLARTEWEHINRVLADTGSNISETARRLNIHRRSLQRKLQKYPPRF